MNLIYLVLIFVGESLLTKLHGKPLPRPIPLLQLNRDNNQVLIVVSYDAFRNEYLQRNVTPNLLEFRQKGVYADYILNVFPTKTFTNHHSIATGLYPEVHGVTANEVYDINLGYLNYTYNLFHYNPDILPIWALNEKNGGTSGCMMWPGSNFDYKNITCTYKEAYNSKISMKDRIDKVVSWLKNPTAKRPNLIMLYFEIADKIGHAYGPDSPQVTNVIKDLDQITKYLQDELQNNNLTNYTNVIHLSDHGMDGVSSPNFINLTDFIEPGTAEMYGTSPVLQIVPIKGKEEEVYTKLKAAATKNGHFTVYKTDQLPERWHSKNQKRFGPIIALADIDYAFQDMYDAATHYEKTYNITFTSTTKYGVHGYDNALPIMHPIFMAKGPLFRENYKVKPFNTVDLFKLFCKILNIYNPPETSGTYSIVRELLIDDGGDESHGVMGAGSIGIIIFCALIVAVTVFMYIRYKKRRSLYITSR